MTAWKTQFSRQAANTSADDLLAQVGHTVAGKAISDAQFNLLSRQLIDALQPEPSDTILDLCCGNGIFTTQLAAHSRKTIGVDFCELLITIAHANFSKSNLSFHVGDVRNADEICVLDGVSSVNKLVLFAALQHFSRKEFREMLSGLVPQIENLRTIYIGFIPDKARKGLFYDSFKRKLIRCFRVATRTDNFGRWWSREELVHEAGRFSGTCTFSDLPDGLHASKYRFNALITLPARNHENDK